jgi:hypothetical protein
MMRITAWILAAFISGAAFGQMMGGPMATSQYFPLVDGSRYDYMYSGGAWSTSTTVMHGGQTWAGVSGLTAMHTTYVCMVGAACAPDATDFYRMDPDGMHYFGGTGANSTGSQFSMMTFTSPEWVLKNPVMPGTMMGGGSYQNAEMWQANVSGTNSMMGGQNYMSSYQAQALETIATPAGTFANCLHVREQRGSGVTRDVWYAPGVGMVKMTDGTNIAVLTGYSIPGAVAQPGGGAAPLAFIPTVGMWWNPDESGTGYFVQVQHGVLVTAIFSYNPAGDPLWYYASGTLANLGSGIAVSSTLDRYHGGQCASCSYQHPALTGNDGAFAMIFSSPTRATLQLPGGRVTQIQPFAW